MNYLDNCLAAARRCTGNPHPDMWEWRGNQHLKGKCECVAKPATDATPKVFTKKGRIQVKPKGKAAFVLNGQQACQFMQGMLSCMNELYFQDMAPESLQSEETLNETKALILRLQRRLHLKGERMTK